MILYRDDNWVALETVMTHTWSWFNINDPDDFLEKSGIDRFPLVYDGFMESIYRELLW